VVIPAIIKGPEKTTPPELILERLFVLLVCRIASVENAAFIATWMACRGEMPLQYQSVYAHVHVWVATWRQTPLDRDETMQSQGALRATGRTRDASRQLPSARLCFRHTMRVIRPYVAR
jgi:hypothetical protein